MKFEFRVVKLSISNVRDSEDKLNALGKDGFALQFSATKDNFVYAILQKEKKPLGRPPAKKAASKKAK
jgi:hypothetical protein